MPHAKPPEAPASSELNALADEIRVEIAAAEASWNSALEHAIAAGEKLIQAKKFVRHGEWLAWLEANCPVNERQAQNYMRLSRNAKRVADLPSIREAIAELTPAATFSDQEIGEAIDQGESRSELAEDLNMTERAVSDAVIRHELRQRADARERLNIAQPHQPDDAHRRMGMRLVTGGRWNEHGEIAHPRPRLVRCPHCGETHECQGYWGPKPDEGKVGWEGAPRVAPPVSQRMSRIIRCARAKSLTTGA